MGSADEGRLRSAVLDVAADAGVDLEDLQVVRSGRRRVVKVVVDCDGGVDLDAAAEVSRAISQRLDGPDDPMGSEPYVLEVTSPGIGRPLTLPRHFRRATSRLLAISLIDGSRLDGHVLTADDTAVTLLTGPAADEVRVPFEQITKARVEVEFGEPPAAVRSRLATAPAAQDTAPAAQDTASAAQDTASAKQDRATASATEEES